MTSPAQLASIASVDDVQEAVRTSPSIAIHGAQTKPNLIPLSRQTLALDMTGLTGIVEYLPEEYTFTAMAGTRLSDIADALRQNGQYMPFDPPLVNSGATLGGTIAAGLSGARRYRYGGIRDFIVGIHFVDGHGQLVRGGGKVVKNAAGFDFPKLFVGSTGTLGVIIEASFKVFPEPPASGTVKIEFPDMEAAVASLQRLNRSAYDIDAIDVAPVVAGTANVWVRFAGLPSSMAARCQRLIDFLGHGQQISDEEGRAFWEIGRDFEWADQNSALVKIPITPVQIAELDAHLHAGGSARRYSVGGNVAWVAWPGPILTLHELLASLALQGMVLRAAESARFIGKYTPSIFADRVKQALDPERRFPDL